MTANTDQRPMAPRHRLTMAYWSAAARGELAIGHCNACKGYSHPVQTECPFCWSSDIEPVAAAGTGTIDTYSIVHRNGAAFFEAMTPYAVAMVRLTEGPAMVSNVLAANLDDVRIGAKVVVRFEKIDDEVAVPVFRLESEA